MQSQQVKLGNVKTVKLGEAFNKKIPTSKFAQKMMKEQKKKSKSLKVRYEYYLDVKGLYEKVIKRKQIERPHGIHSFSFLVFVNLF